MNEEYIKSIEIWGNKERKLSEDIVTWANGASDHLYEIEAPEGEDWDEIRDKVKELKRKGLGIGHGFTDTMWTYKDYKELKDMTEEIALMIDERLGLNPDIGEW